MLYAGAMAQHGRPSEDVRATHGDAQKIEELGLSSSEDAEARSLCRRLLTSQWQRVEHVAAALMRVERLKGEGLQRVLAGGEL